MTARLVVGGAGTVALALWALGVAGWLGTGRAENWVLFALGALLVVASGAVLPGRE
jgi:hypothetical protein